MTHRSVWLIVVTTMILLLVASEPWRHRTFVTDWSLVKKGQNLILFLLEPNLNSVSMATPSGWSFKNMVLIGQFYLLVVDWLVNTHFCDGGHLLGKKTILIGWSKLFVSDWFPIGNTFLLVGPILFGSHPYVGGWKKITWIISRDGHVIKNLVWWIKIVFL